MGSRAPEGGGGEEEKVISPQLKEIILISDQIGSKRTSKCHTETESQESPAGNGVPNLEDYNSIKRILL